ncbi:MAG: DUF3570 domain-containing protein [Myxococcales bacterium]|nr:DUF3570 domain-containing protein [Myxococcales bacterium]
MSYRLLALVLIGCAGHAPRVTDASSTVYLRSDTDATTILSPTVRVAGAMDGATLAGTYTVDAWTGASVDVVTAATKAITERRDEVDATAGYTRGIVNVTANYRYSHEPDYRSHGLTLGGKAELAGKNTTVAVDLLASDDTVGRSGDPSFGLPVRTVGARASVAQLLDPKTIVEVGWQTTLIDGYQASPYRFVAIGDLGTCASSAPYCIPEQVPDTRVRNAATLRGRRALGRRMSLGLEYRFYFDDWHVLSHAVQPDLALRLGESSMLSLRYRYTTQSEASFYRPRYFDLMDSSGYVTRDRKLSALVTNELGAQYLRTLESDDGDKVLTWGLRSTLSRADYLAYVGLDHVWAVELTALVGVAMP